MQLNDSKAMRCYAKQAMHCNAKQRNVIQSNTYQCKALDSLAMQSRATQRILRNGLQCDSNATQYKATHINSKH
eukprot:9352879-Pyramimonas_sp.AAC.1